MNQIIAPKLRRGDTVRVIAPARSMKLPWITKEVTDLAKSRFKEIGLNLTFGKNVSEINEFSSSSIKSRVEDLHDAFREPSVRIVLTAIGGFNSIEILEHLDYSLIKENPKILCGYSDITALENAIFAQTGLVTYSGPHFFDFGDLKGFDFTLDYFKKCFFNSELFEVKSSNAWSNDRWAKDQIHRSFCKNKGMYVLQKGKAEGTILGANLVTFHSLSGTEYFPKVKESIILFLEDDDHENIDTINRMLYSLSLQRWFSSVKGIVFGRFQPESKIGKKELMLIINANDKLRGIPIIADGDFGHTTPKITFPIGGSARLVASKSVKLEILSH